MGHVHWDIHCAVKIRNVSNALFILFVGNIMTARTSDDQRRQKPRKRKLNAKQKKEQQLLIAKLALYFADFTRMLNEGKRVDDEQFQTLLVALQLFRENNLGEVQPLDEEKRTNKQGDDTLLYPEESDFYQPGTVVHAIKDVNDEYQTVIGIVVEHDDQVIKLKVLNTDIDASPGDIQRVTLPLLLWEVREITKYSGMEGLYYGMAIYFPEQYRSFTNLEQFAGNDALLSDIALRCEEAYIQGEALRHMSSDLSRGNTLANFDEKTDQPKIELHIWKRYFNTLRDPIAIEIVIQAVLMQSTVLNGYVSHIVGGTKFTNLINQIIQDMEDGQIMPWLERVEQTRKHRKAYADNVGVIKTFYGKLTQKTLCCMFAVEEYDVHTRISILDHIIGDKRYKLAADLYNEVYREHKIFHNSVIAVRIREVLDAQGYERLDPEILSNLISCIEHDSSEGRAIIQAMTTRSCLARFKKVQLTYRCQGHIRSLQSVREAVIDYLLASFQELIDNDEQQALYRLSVDLQVYLIDEVEILIEDSEEEDYRFELQVCEAQYVQAFRLHVKAWETYVEKYNQIPRKDSEEKYEFIKAHLAELDAA